MELDREAARQQDMGDMPRPESQGDPQLSLGETTQGPSMALPPKSRLEEFRTRFAEGLRRFAPVDEPEGEPVDTQELARQEVARTRGTPSVHRPADTAHRQDADARAAAARLHEAPPAGSTPSVRDTSHQQLESRRPADVAPQRRRDVLRPSDQSSEETRTPDTRPYVPRLVAQHQVSFAGQNPRTIGAPIERTFTGHLERMAVQSQEQGEKQWGLVVEYGPPDGPTTEAIETAKEVAAVEDWLQVRDYSIGDRHSPLWTPGNSGLVANAIARIAAGGDYNLNKAAVDDLQRLERALTVKVDENTNIRPSWEHIRDGANYAGVGDRATFDEDAIPTLSYTDPLSMQRIKQLDTFIHQGLREDDKAIFSAIGRSLKLLLPPEDDPRPGENADRLPEMKGLFPKSEDPQESGVRVIRYRTDARDAESVESVEDEQRALISGVTSSLIAKTGAGVPSLYLASLGKEANDAQQQERIISRLINKGGTRIMLAASGLSDEAMRLIGGGERPVIVFTGTSSSDFAEKLERLTGVDPRTEWSGASYGSNVGTSGGEHVGVNVTYKKAGGESIESGGQSQNLDDTWSDGDSVTHNVQVRHDARQLPQHEVGRVAVNQIGVAGLGDGPPSIYDAHTEEFVRQVEYPHEEQAAQLEEEYRGVRFRGIRVNARGEVIEAIEGEVVPEPSQALEPPRKLAIESKVGSNRLEPLPGANPLWDQLRKYRSEGLKSDPNVELKLYRQYYTHETGRSVGGITGPVDRAREASWYEHNMFPAEYEGRAPTPTAEAIRTYRKYLKEVGVNESRLALDRDDSPGAYEAAKRIWDTITKGLHVGTFDQRLAVLGEFYGREREVRDRYDRSLIKSRDRLEGWYGRLLSDIAKKHGVMDVWKEKRGMS